MYNPENHASLHAYMHRDRLCIRLGKRFTLGSIKGGVQVLRVPRREGLSCMSATNLIRIFKECFLFIT